MKPNYPLFKFADPMLNKMIKHLWYLSEELAISCLFDPNTTQAVKAHCAKVIVKQHHEGEDNVNSQAEYTDMANVWTQLLAISPSQ